MAVSFSSETHAYGWIKRELKRKGFDTKNPARDPRGEVYTQHECNQNGDIKEALDGGIPENIVQLDARTFWVLEAKSKPKDLDKAYQEAIDYAETANRRSQSLKIILASGVAGSDEDGYRAKTALFLNGEWQVVKIRGKQAIRLLKREEIGYILSHNTQEITKRELTNREVVELSNVINKRLHKAKVTKEKRAATVAVLVLALSESPSLKLASDPDIFINDINTRAEKVFTKSNKTVLWNQIKLVPPSEDNHAFAIALDDVIKHLHRAEIITNSADTDILGSFFEQFLRYGNTVKDIGIVLTPRHICWFVAEILNIASTDVVYDPAVGSGGFLIAAYNRVLEYGTTSDAMRFAKKHIFGADDNGPVASLAFVNMYFRGDGKHNLRNASCFTGRLSAPSIISENVTFKEGKDFGKKEYRIATKVMMNPPFALPADEEKEWKFVNHALDQLQDNGLLFTVLPSSIMYSSEFSYWRGQLMTEHQVLSVVLFPNDLFYPTAVETVGVFIRKGTPQNGKEVLWIRMDDDGFVKWKGFRVEKSGRHYKDWLKKCA